MARLRLLGATGGAVFAVVTLVAFAIAPGPASVRHRVLRVVRRDVRGGDVVGRRRSVGAGAIAAVYLVTLGTWESLGETYRGVDAALVPSESYGDAHVLYDVGVGAAHMASFADAAFVGATAAALLTAAGRR